MTLLTMQVCCDCSHPEIIGMDPEGVFESDHDGARCYAWKCPECGSRTLVRLNFPEEEE